MGLSQWGGQGAMGAWRYETISIHRGSPDPARSSADWPPASAQRLLRPAALTAVGLDGRRVAAESDGLF